MPKKRTIKGVYAPPPRPTIGGALWTAMTLSLPVGVMLGGLELLWRALS